MKGDKLNCPNCNQEYSEEFAESKIEKRFLCENCEINLMVKVTPKGYITIRKNQKNSLYNKKRQAYEDDDYIFRKMKEYILYVKKEYNGNMFKTFLTRPNVPWVKKSRAMLLEDLNIMDISRDSIRIFFKRRGGNIGEMTLIKYIKKLKR